MRAQHVLETATAQRRWAKRLEGFESSVLAAECMAKIELHHPYAARPPRGASAVALPQYGTKT